MLYSVTYHDWIGRAFGRVEELKHILDDANNIPVNASERLFYLMRNDPASPLRGTMDSK